MPHSTGLRPPAARRPRALPVPTIGASAGPPGDSHALVRALLSAVRARQDRFLGFPADLGTPEVDDTALLAEAMRTYINQVGDAYDITAHDISLKPLEQAIIEWATGLTRGAPGTYGYVTTGRCTP